MGRPRGRPFQSICPRLPPVAESGFLRRVVIDHDEA
jgi:hypothetical protein